MTLRHRLLAVLSLGLFGCSGGGPNNLDGGSDGGRSLGVAILSEAIGDDGMGGTSISTVASANLSLQQSTQSCTETVIGKCRVISCPSFNGGPPPSYAGPISITTPKNATNPVIVDFDGGNYLPVRGVVELFESGDQVSFSATGGPVPAFSGTVSAPAPITLTPPAVDGGPVIDRAVDFSIDWDIVGNPNGKVGLTVASSMSTVLNASCTFDVADGTGVVPAAALQMLPAGPGVLTGSSYNVVVVPAGNAGTVTLEVIALGDGTKVHLQ